MPPAEELEKRVLSALRWRLLPFLFLLYIVAYMDRINVGFAALQMQSQLHFTDRVYGLGAGIFFAGYFLFQIPSNLVLGRLGARRWIALLMVVWGTVSSLTLLTRTPAEFYWFRFLLGSAEAGFFPGMIFYLKSWFPEAARARAVALFMTAGPVAGVIGGPLSGLLLGLDGRGGVRGWQWLFLVEGIPAVVMGLVVLRLLKDSPQKAGWLTVEEKNWLSLQLAREGRTSQTAGVQSPFRVLAGPTIWLLAFVCLALNTCSYGISLWLPTMIHSWSRVSRGSLGWISAVPYLVAAIVMVLVGRHSDRTGERTWHVALSALAGAAALLVAAYSESLVVSVGALSLAMTAVSSMVGPFWALPTRWWQGSSAAVGIAAINSLGNLGGFLGPYLIGALRTESGSFRAGLLAVALALGMGAVIMLFGGEGPKERA